MGRPFPLTASGTLLFDYADLMRANMNHELVLSKFLQSDAVAPTPAPVNFAGKWKNQYGSTADIQVKGSEVSGTYTSLVSSTNKTISGPIRGYLSGDIIALTVLWPAKAGSITAWVGQVVDVKGTQTLKTLWHLVVNIPDADEKTGLWTSIYCGADDFRKV
jgi:uncharacterized protein (DUF2147 family)